MDSTEIDYYVITLKHADRMKNIQRQQDKMPENRIELVDAVLGDNLDLEEMVISKKLAPAFSEKSKKRHREVGCFMSHLKVYELISARYLENPTSKYSVIFEDDFALTDDFQEKLMESLMVVKNLDFDYLYLGNNQSIAGKHVNQNVYKNNNEQPLYGTYGYVVNNQNIRKMIESMQYIDRPIDNQIDDYSNEGKLNVYVVQPTIVNYAETNLPSTIVVDGFGRKN